MGFYEILIWFFIWRWDVYYMGYSLINISVLIYWLINLFLLFLIYKKCIIKIFFLYDGNWGILIFSCWVIVVLKRSMVLIYYIMILNVFLFLKFLKENRKV